MGTKRVRNSRGNTKVKEEGALSCWREGALCHLSRYPLQLMEDAAVEQLDTSWRNCIRQIMLDNKQWLIIFWNIIFYNKNSSLNSLRTESSLLYKRVKPCVRVLLVCIYTNTAKAKIKRSDLAVRYKGPFYIKQNIIWKIT